MEEQKTYSEVNQDRRPNFRGDNGKLYLVKCFICDPKYGLENYVIAVSMGQCYKCGWREKTNDK